MSENQNAALVAVHAVIDACARRLEAAVGLDVLCRAAAEHLDVAAVAVSVPIIGTGADTIAAHGPLARAGEELQVILGEGPSLEVLAGAHAVLVEDFAAPGPSTRWPLFAPTAAQAGIASMCVLPMRIGAARFGALVIYLDRPGNLRPERLADALLFALLGLNLLVEHLADTHPDYGANFARTGTASAPDEDEDEDTAYVRRFVDDRPQIHQATGIISIQLGVDLPTALLRLRARAFAEGRLLSELSADVLSRTVRFTDDGPGGEARGGLDPSR